MIARKDKGKCRNKASIERMSALTLFNSLLLDMIYLGPLQNIFMIEALREVGIGVYGRPPGWVKVLNDHVFILSCKDDPGKPEPYSRP